MVTCTGVTSLATARHSAYPSEPMVTTSFAPLGRCERLVHGTPEAGLLRAIALHDVEVVEIAPDALRDDEHHRCDGVARLNRDTSKQRSFPGGSGLLGNASGGHQSHFDGRLILKARIR